MINSNSARRKSTFIKNMALKFLGFYVSRVLRSSNMVLPMSYIKVL